MGDFPINVRKIINCWWIGIFVLRSVAVLTVPADLAFPAAVAAVGNDDDNSTRKTLQWTDGQVVDVWVSMFAWENVDDDDGVVFQMTRSKKQS